MNFAHGSDYAALHPFAGEAHSFARMALIAHLRDHAVAAGGQHQFSRLPDGARQRLLDKHVLTHADRQQTRGVVQVVRGRDRNGVNALVELAEHLPVVLKLRHGGVAAKDRFRLGSIHVAERDDVFAAHTGDVRDAFAATANAGDAHFLIGL